MSRSLKIGITGGIGVGKSTICRVFSALGAPVYDADSQAKAIMKTNAVLKSEIKTHFGEASYFTSGELNRTFLARTVFNNPNKLKILNSLIHPKVQEDAHNWILKYDGTFPYLMKEAALLFESGSYQSLDKIIAVSAPLDIRIQRVLQRDVHRKKSDIEAIIAKQMPQEEKEQYADFIVYNNEQKMIIPQVLALHQLFINYL